MEISSLNERQLNFRNETFDTLVLISSLEEQLDYQAKVPYINVSNELFNSWESCYEIVIDRQWYKEAFSIKELAVLQEFNKVLNDVCSETEPSLPPLCKFVKTDNWLKLSNAAKLAMEELNAT